MAIILGTGGCGFLRAYHLLAKNGINVKYKKGQVKYQNGFEKWNPDTGLIWEAPLDSKRRAVNYLNELSGATDICHYALPYVDDLIQIDPKLRFACIEGDYGRTIMALWTQWAYRNPLVNKRGVGRPRYVLSQFPDYSNLDYLSSVIKFVSVYYELAHKYATKYPDNFRIFNNTIFTSTESQKAFTEWVGFTAPFTDLPLSDENIFTTSLHGGFGNNLFQMAEPIAFCSQFCLNPPVFGTWDVRGYPQHYGADRLLGGHIGSHERFHQTLKNLNWKDVLVNNFDTKFMLNDMFDFSKIHHKRDVLLKAYAPTDSVLEYIHSKYSYEKPTVSLHIRSCTLAADDHDNGHAPFDYYVRALREIDDNALVMVFSDNNEIAKSYIARLKEQSNKQFLLTEEDQFTSLHMISLCTDHIIDTSTFGFWGAYLDLKQPNCKTFVPLSFERNLGTNMIPYQNWIRL